MGVDRYNIYHVTWLNGYFGGVFIIMLFHLLPLLVQLVSAKILDSDWACTVETILFLGLSGTLRGSDWWIFDENVGTLPKTSRYLDHPRGWLSNVISVQVKEPMYLYPRLFVCHLRRDTIHAQCHLGIWSGRQRRSSVRCCIRCTAPWTRHWWSLCHSNLFGPIHTVSFCGFLGNGFSLYVRSNPHNDIVAVMIHNTYDVCVSVLCTGEEACNNQCVEGTWGGMSGGLVV